MLSLPLGAPNSITQSLALLLLAPIAFIATKSAIKKPIFITILIGTLLVSLFQVALNPNKEYSVYQAIRSALPFYLLCAIVVSYKKILARIIAFEDRTPGSVQKLFDRAVRVFATLSFIQTTTFFLGFSLANALSQSENDRVMIFQTTSIVLVFFYSIIRRNFINIFLTSIVIIGTGSKAIFVATLLLTFFAAYSRPKFSMLLKIVGGTLILGGTLFYFNPLVIERLAEFAINSDGEKFKDATREYEIEQAKETLLENPATTVLGAGFAMQVSHGVPSLDPAWEENSKYDIENGYWGALVKLGFFFTMLFALSIAKGLPRDEFLMAILLVQSVMFMKTSYQLFAYMDGVCMLLWSICMVAINKINANRNSHQSQFQQSIQR